MPRLRADGYAQFRLGHNGMYLEKHHDTARCVFLQQAALKPYMKLYHPEAEVIRNPDECFIVEHPDGTCCVNILEKKSQNVAGTVENKLWAAHSFKREYELLLGPNVVVKYAFCVNPFIKAYLLSDRAKYVALNQILREDNELVTCLKQTHMVKAVHSITNK